MGWFHHVPSHRADERDVALVERLEREIAALEQLIGRQSQADDLTRSDRATGALRERNLREEIASKRAELQRLGATATPLSRSLTGGAAGRAALIARFGRS